MDSGLCLLGIIPSTMGPLRDCGINMCYTWEISRREKKSSLRSWELVTTSGASWVAQDSVPVAVAERLYQGSRTHYVYLWGHREHAHPHPHPVLSEAAKCTSTPVDLQSWTHPLTHTQGQKQWKMTSLPTHGQPLWGQQNAQAVSAAGFLASHCCLPWGRGIGSCLPRSGQGYWGIGIKESSQIHLRMVMSGSSGSWEELAGQKLAELWGEENARLAKKGTERKVC